MLIFFLPFVFQNIWTISLLIKNTKPILVLAIPVRVPMPVVNEQRETPLYAHIQVL